MMLYKEEKVVLASKSPRRRELLGGLFSSFDVITEDVDESFPENMSVRDGTAVIAERKGRAVLAKVGEDRLIISSDTVVEIDGVALGKPKDREDAAGMLRSLSGRTHHVHTGVAVHYKGRMFSGVDTTSVTFKQLSDEEIYAYVDSGEPMDKAGSYGIQGDGGRFVLSYEGEMDTVIGLCIKLTEKLVRNSGFYDDNK